MRYYFKAAKMAIIKRPEKTRAGEDTEQGHLSVRAGSVNLQSHYGKQWFPQNPKGRINIQSSRLTSKSSSKRCEISVPDTQPLTEANIQRQLTRRS